MYFFHQCRQIKVGDPSDPSNMMGALVSKEHLAKVSEKASERESIISCTCPMLSRQETSITEPSLIWACSLKSPEMLFKLLGKYCTRDLVKPQVVA